MSVTFSYSSATYNLGRLSNELVAGGVTVLTVRGKTTSIQVECADGTAQATVDGIVAAHTGTATPPHDAPALTGGTSTYVRADGTLGTPAGTGDPAGTAAAAVAAHEAAADPHTGYQRESEKGNANGYASLGAGGLVPIAQIASGTPTGSKFVRDDGTLQVPPGGGGPHATDHQNGGTDEISVAGLSGLLADPQTPFAHATAHGPGGGDQLKLDDLTAPDDNTDLDASTTKHGLEPKGTGSTLVFRRGDSTWSTAPGRLRGVFVYTTGTGATHTPSAGTTMYRIIAVGAGGGGGGADGSSSNAGCGGGGSSGGVVYKWLATAPTLTYTVPSAGGNGGTAGNNAGIAGADTTVAGTGISLTAKGGNGGSSMAAGNTFATAAGGTSAAGTTGGDLNVAGGVGDPGVRNSGTISQGGRGADGPFGNGGAPGIVAAAGGNATGHGAGGGGGGTQGNADRAGGNGAPGLLIIEEYF